MPDQPANANDRAQRIGGAVPPMPAASRSRGTQFVPARPSRRAGNHAARPVEDAAATTGRIATAPEPEGEGASRTAEFASPYLDELAHADSKKPGGPRRAGLIAAAVVAGVLAVGYVAGAVAFSGILYPNTTIAGVDVSLMTVDDATAQVEASTAHYKLKVTGGDFSWEYEPEDASSIVDARDRVTQVMEANGSLAWPVRLIQALSGTDSGAVDADSATLPESFDKTGFEQGIGAAIDAYNQGRSGTFDGASAYDPDEKAFSAEKALSNVQLDKDRATKAAEAALAGLETDLELDRDCFATFANGATDEQIQAACDAANKLVAHTIKLTMGGVEVQALDGDQLYQWVSFGDDLTPTLNADSMTEWLRQLTIDSLDTVGTERTYTRANGKKVTVSGGTYGWTVDSATLATKVKEAIDAGQDATIEVPTSSAGDTFTKRGERDWGAYIDIDLTEQHAYYYDASNNLKWESGVITGNPNEGNDTPAGVYRMNELARDITLVGKDDPNTGEPIYKTPVSYWMPFIGGAIGLHDASWQASYNFSNPTAYLAVGSHGCVNLPPDKAAELYNMVQAGLCVIVHW